MSKKYIIKRSNYSLKREHKPLSNGTIYERDYMATTNLGRFESNAFPHEESNFKFVPVDSATVRRRHNHKSHEEEYTLLDINNSNVAPSTESEIVLNKKHTSLLDFAYYGNCVELLKSAVNNIIKGFPAEMYFSGKQQTVNGTQWHILENPFGIDIWDITAVAGADAPSNELRYFYLKKQNYYVFDSNGISLGCLNTEGDWAVEENVSFRKCEGEYSHIITITIGGTEIEIRRYYVNKQFMLLYNDENVKRYYIRPADEYIDDAFKNMGDFENTLLNRNTVPKYTATLDYPHETESGFKTHKRSFTWPCSASVINEIDSGDTGQTVTYVHRYNIDISGEKYELYINSLIELCNFYDTYFTDNIWRNLTHDAIKNLDNTFIHENSNEDKGDIKENVEKVQKFLYACGRQFDDIKRYADGIKDVNTITYNDENNIPDYFLTDALGLSGWEITSSIATLQSSDKTVTGLFKGENNKVYHLSDVNVQFLKNLKLNSREIFSRKGTKYGLEMILGLFGMTSKDYEINEFVTIATPKEQSVLSTEKLNVETYGMMRKQVANSMTEPDEDDILEGLPVKIITFEKQVGGILKTYKCMVPWFTFKNTNGRPQTLNGNLYFQMYGGWEKNEDEQYNETLNYLGVVENENDLTYVPTSKLHGDDVFFVINKDTYYILRKGKSVGVIGEDGWERIEPVDKIDPEDTESINPAYLESEYGKYDMLFDSIIDISDGNNPHVGFNQYDDGKEFYEYLKQVFKADIDSCGFTDDAYNCTTNELESGVTDCGFNVSEKIRDNVKCWYFTAGQQLPNGGFDNGGDLTTNTFDGTRDYDDENLLPYDYKTGVAGKFTEFAPYSMVNDKTMEMTFKIPAVFSTDEKKQEYEDYVMSAVMPYVRQLIPSTTIFSIKFEQGNE